MILGHRVKLVSQEKSRRIIQVNYLELVTSCTSRADIWYKGFVQKTWQSMHYKTVDYPNCCIASEPTISALYHSKLNLNPRIEASLKRGNSVLWHPNQSTRDCADPTSRSVARPAQKMHLFGFSCLASPQIPNKKQPPTHWAFTSSHKGWAYSPLPHQSSGERDETSYQTAGRGVSMWFMSCTLNIQPVGPTSELECLDLQGPFKQWSMVCLFFFSLHILAQLLQ